MIANSRRRSSRLLTIAAVASLGFAGVSFAATEPAEELLASFHDYDAALARELFFEADFSVDAAGLVNAEFASDEVSPGDIIGVDVVRVRVPEDFLNPGLVPAGTTDLPGSFTRSGADDQFAVPGDWIVATMQVAAPPDCSTWGIESTIAWTGPGRTPAVPNPEVVNDPVAGFTGIDSFKLEACRPFDEHSLQVEGEWQRFQSLVTQTTVRTNDVLETRFMIPPRQNSGITALRLIGFGFDFENSQANPDTVHFEFIDIPIEAVPLLDWFDLPVTTPGENSTALIAGTPVPDAVPFAPPVAAPEPTDDAEADPDAAVDPDADSEPAGESSDPADAADAAPELDAEDPGEADASAGGDEPADAVADGSQNADGADATDPNSADDGTDSGASDGDGESGGLSTGAVLAAGLAVAGFGLAVPGWILWKRKERKDADRDAAAADARRRVKQSQADNAENDRRLYRQLVDAALDEGQQPIRGRVDISRELYDRVILFGHADDPDVKLHLFDSIGTQGRASGDPDEFETYDHFSIDVETLDVRSGWDEKFADESEERWRDRDGGRGGPPKPGDPEYVEPLNMDDGLPPA